MARYNVSFSSSECGRLHPTKIFLTRGEEFAARKTLAEVYKAEHPVGGSYERLIRRTAMARSLSLKPYPFDDSR
jgi:hypothetical protein